MFSRKKRLLFEVLRLKVLRFNVEGKKKNELMNNKLYNNKIMKIGIFCSANNNIDPDFFRLADDLATWMGNNGHTLVWGGCNLGLMQQLGTSIKAAGGRCIGIVPQIIEKGGRAFPDIDIYIPCDSLSDRKDLLLAHSDIIIALPGGIGTLDEIFTVAAAHTIGYHSKKIILLNAKGFWDSLIAMLDDLQSKGVIRGQWRDYILVANSVEEAVSASLSSDT